MITFLRRQLRAYGAVAAMVPKLMLAYRAWFWMEAVVQIIALVIFYFFWQAVYAGHQALGGLSLGQTLNYVLLAQIVLPVVQPRLVFQFGDYLREGQFGPELLRPLDLQARLYVETVCTLLAALFQRIPLALFAWLALGLRVRGDPRIVAAFIVSLLLGQAIIFCVDWTLACLAFYTTETWGLLVVQQGVATFFSGALIPLALMPAWLQQLMLSLPFAQALYVPVSLLSGITPAGDAPRMWLVQLVWLIGMLAASRALFRVAVRRVTVQGG